MTEHPNTLSIPESISRRVTPVVAVTGVIAVLFVGAGLLIATLFAPNGRDTTVVTGFVVSIIGPTVLGLLTLSRGDHAAKLGAANAKKLDATIETVEQVAKDVNGHLARHDKLAENVMAVATGVAQAAGVPIATQRDPETRTRTTDMPAPEVTGVDAAPLADQG